MALGGTKWGMVTDVILPFARNGILGGVLLGLGRALGETVAVLLILSQTNVVHTQHPRPRRWRHPGPDRQPLRRAPLGKSALTAGGSAPLRHHPGDQLRARRIVGRPQVKIQ